MTIFSKTQVNEIALALKSGKAVVLPTDTVWGIASLSEQQIYSIKHRAKEKKVIKFVDGVESTSLPSFFGEVIKKYWPGALTIIWKGISYRMPDCPYIIDILKITGPLYQSSANISGNDPLTSPEDVPKVFSESMEQIEVVKNDPYQALSNQPSTIVDLDKLIVVRSGQIDGQAIIKQLKERVK